MPGVFSLPKLAARLVVIVLGFELGLCRVTAGPQSSSQVLFDAGVLAALAFAVQQASRWAPRSPRLHRLRTATLWGVGVGVPWAAAFSVVLLVMLTRHHPHTLSVGAIWAGVTFAVLVLCLWRLDERASPWAVAGLLLAAPVLVWTLREGEIPWWALAGTGVWTLVVVWVSGRSLAAVPVGAALAAWLPVSLLGPLPIQWPDRAGESEAPDLILIVADTLRASDAQEMRSYARIADQGVELGPAQAAATWTLPSMASMMTSLPAEQHGASRSFQHEVSTIRGDVPTLAELLSQAGYDTAAVVGENPNVGPKLGFGRGFDYFDFDGSLSYRYQLPVARSARGRPLLVQLIFASFKWVDAPRLKRWLDYGGRDDGHTLVDRALAVLEQRRDRPLFLWIHFMDVHLPYQHGADLPNVADSIRGSLTELHVSHVRAPRQAWLSEERRSVLRQGYRWEIEQLDLAIGRLLDRLPPTTARGRVVVLTSDHGEEFFEHGDFEHGHTFYQEVIGVPLVISGLPETPPAKPPHPASLLDVAPTLLAAAGAETPRHMHGQNLAEPIRSRALTAMGLLYADSEEELDGAFAVRVGPWKLIEHEGSFLFDLQADVGEQTNLAEGKPGDVAGLRRHKPQGIQRGQPAHLDEADLNSLRALGYVP